MGDEYKGEVLGEAQGRGAVTKCGWNVGQRQRTLRRTRWWCCCSYAETWRPANDSKTDGKKRLQWFLVTCLADRDRDSCGNIGCLPAVLWKQQCQ